MHSNHYYLILNGVISLISETSAAVLIDGDEAYDNAEDRSSKMAKGNSSVVPAVKEIQSSSQVERLR